MRAPLLRRKQNGAIAIEFAVLFGIFFAVLYAIIAYSIPLLLMLTFKQVAADAARAAIAVDPAAEKYADNLELRVRSVIEESWLGSLDEANKWHAGCASDSDHTALVGRTLTVCIRYRSANYNSDPIIPAITLPVIGQIPRLPDLIEAETTIRL